jgi:glycerol-3-phosphate acyltransferase PlsY
MLLDVSPAVAAVCLALGYLFGSIPFGLLLTKAAGTADLRTIGSGNIGATNVLRTGRKDLAAATLLLDAAKAAVAYLVAYYLARLYSADADAAGLAAAAGAVLGHLYPVWLKFKGGKGVATFLGGLIAANIWAALVFAAVWLIVAAATRYSSAAALVASVAAPVAAFALGDHRAGLAFALLAALVWMKHSANIQRLVRGTEPRIGAKA